MLRYLLRLVLHCLFKTKVNGFAQMRFDEPTIILPNHLSFLDPIFLYAYLPKDVCYVINTDIAEKISFFLRFINHIRIDPLNPYSLKKILSVLKAGNPLVIFPEGRITRTGSLMKIYSRIGFIAFRTNAAIYPVILTAGKDSYKVSAIEACFWDSGACCTLLRHMELMKEDIVPRERSADHDSRMKALPEPYVKHRTP